MLRGIEFFCLQDVKIYLLLDSSDMYIEDVCLIRPVHIQ